MKLLSPASANVKMAKNSQFTHYLSAILHLSPSDVSGYNTCPAASPGCKLACLNTAGRGRFNNVQQARIRKTRLLFTDRPKFMKLLIGDLNKLAAKAKKANKLAVVRLNGTSDIEWENLTIPGSTGINIFQLFPDIKFYDYTKLAKRLTNNLPKNYSLTFSMSEVNEVLSKRVLALGHNVAVVFKDKLPPNYLGREVIDGTTHDFRFKDKKNVVVGLLAKGKAKKDLSGFVKVISNYADK